jgi:two-component system, chemotaxis family, protein-glutamate methylesterase/glutaminase
MPTRPPIELIVIGASAGGVAALLALLRPLPAGFALPIVVVLHLLARHESQLAAVLSHHLALPVREPRDKEPVCAGTVYVAGADYHLLIEADRSFAFSSDPPVSFARPSIDVLMASAADAYGPALAGLLLTGANMDGAEGMAAIHARGGLTLVQQPGDADVATMPEAAIARSRPDHILALKDMSSMLMKLASAEGAA